MKKVYTHQSPNIRVKKLEDRVLECAISTATKNRHIQPLKYNPYLFSFSIFMHAAIRLCRFLQFIRRNVFL